MHTPHSLRKQSGNWLVSIVLSIVLPAVLLGVLIMWGGSVAPSTSTPEEDFARSLRLQKVGTVAFEIKQEGERPLLDGQGVYKAQCSSCHSTGVSGAPKFGNADEWGPRLGQGFDALVQSSLKGKGAMTPQGGGRWKDVEVARAVAYMANQAGANFKEPNPE